ncbi:hypothetical protein CDES_11040 [Corynebacterium deserti GIMN1.010]|uniref:Uncharacterized protein n=1 Tax=Corynebacterium deserti GIMN1.010 TaxID=931089 RepID=A0A0M5IGH2_9CORY|nr:hypothetical protein CDES_11040 [Corynebacterium deserti GIMN1.010]
MDSCAAARSARISAINAPPEPSSPCAWTQKRFNMGVFKSIGTRGVAKRVEHRIGLKWFLQAAPQPPPAITPQSRLPSFHTTQFHLGALPASSTKTERVACRRSPLAPHQPLRVQPLSQANDNQRCRADPKRGGSNGHVDRQERDRCCRGTKEPERLNSRQQR